MDIVLFLVAFLVFLIVIFILAMVFKYSDMQIKALKEFTYTSEDGVLSKDGRSRNLKTGNVLGQRRPSGNSIAFR